MLNLCPRLVIWCEVLPCTALCTYCSSETVFSNYPPLDWSFDFFDPVSNPQLSDCSEVNLTGVFDRLSIQNDEYATCRVERVETSFFSCEITIPYPYSHHAGFFTPFNRTFLPLSKAIFETPNVFTLMGRRKILDRP